MTGDKIHKVQQHRISQWRDGSLQSIHDEQLRIARKTLLMPPEMADVMGGMTRQEATCLLFENARRELPLVPNRNEDQS